jgi:hypothetical protein
MVMRRMRSGLVARSPYQRIVGAGDEGWMRQSRLRQILARQLDDDEVASALAEVVVEPPDSPGRTHRGWVAVTDRALHLRYALTRDVHRTLRIGYGDVRQVQVGDPDGPDLRVTYFAPDRVSHSWYQQLRLSEPSTPGLRATLQRLVGEYAVATSEPVRADAVEPAPAPERIPVARDTPVGRGPVHAVGHSKRRAVAVP